LNSLYDTDFRTWMQTQIDALRRGDWNALDMDNLIDELESLGRGSTVRLRHELCELLVWFLCWNYAFESRPKHPHWYVRIGSGRVELDVLTHVWPHLRAEAEARLPECYAYAREVASEETGLPLDAFPETCPWTAALIMHSTFWPMGCGETDRRPVWPPEEEEDTP